MTNVVSLYDESGNMFRDWARIGFTVHCFDLLNDDRIEEVGKGRIHYVKGDMRDPATRAKIIALWPVFIGGFPPCDDLTNAGSRHWAAKRLANPNFLDDAMELVRYVDCLANEIGCPWFIENPVGLISSIWRKPDMIFHPWHFGGYLPADDIHPRWPDYIAPRDAYPKGTCLWYGNGFVWPTMRAVAVPEGYSDQYHRLGGKSAKTKQIRSETPRGFARAVFEANAYRYVPQWGFAA